MNAWPSNSPTSQIVQIFWVIQSRGGFGLAAEALDSLWVAGDLVGQELEGDEAFEPDIVRLEDHPCRQRRSDRAACMAPELYLA
jgi:hypothetical protein